MPMIPASSYIIAGYKASSEKNSLLPIIIIVIMTILPVIITELQVLGRGRTIIYQSSLFEL